MVFTIYYKIAPIIALESRREEISIKPLDVVLLIFFITTLLTQHLSEATISCLLLIIIAFARPTCFHEPTVLSNVKNYSDCWQVKRVELFYFYPLPCLDHKIFHIFLLFLSLFLYSTQCIAENVISTK